MAVDHVKSTPITNSDTVPRIANQAGKGAPARLRQVDGTAVAIASSSADATYQLVRIPSTAIVKTITFESEAQGAGKFDLGLYYATGGDSAGAASLLAAAAIDQDFFASDIDCASAVTPTNVTNESTTYTLAKRQQPIWQAVGLSTDPGGYFDVVATVHTTAVTTGTGRLGIQVSFVES